MKFGKRHQPMDFGAAREPLEPRPVFVPAAEPAEDLELSEPVARSAEATPASPLAPPPVQAEIAPARPRLPVRTDEAPVGDGETSRDLPPAWPIYLAATAIAVLWALAPLAFALGYRRAIAPLTQDGFALLVFALLAIGPAAFVFGAAFMLRQSQKLAAESRRSKALADELLAPSLAAAARAGHVTQQIREEIERAAGAADEAREALLALRQTLADESHRLTESASASLRNAQELSGVLGRERGEMQGLAQTLDAQASRVSETITQQARMVADAAQLAETQLREAEAALAARAAGLSAAAGEAGDAARTAGEDLVRHIARLETAGVGVSEQVRAVEGGLSEQRAALITLSHALRADHEGFAAQAEAHAATLGDFIAQARTSADEMNARATAGGEALKQLMAHAAEQFRDLAETARAEREEFGQSTLQSLDAVAQAAADQRARTEVQTRAAIEALHAAAEETRQAAARHAVTAREQVDQLSEAAFAAGQKANQVFEARLEEARALVEQSSRMVEEAGAATARKLDEGAAAARATLHELEAMLGELEGRARQLPASARGQADQVRAAVTQGMDELMAAARRTAEEAQAIDAAFQDRVRRNFEMLSEAVRLMGTVAGAPGPQAVTPAFAPAPAPAASPLPKQSFTAAYTTPTLRASAAVAPAPATPEPEPEAEPSPGVAAVADDGDLQLDEVVEAPQAPPERSPAGAALADRLGLRPRLKLTPTATDEEFSSIFEAAGGPPAVTSADDDEGEEDPEEGEGEGWTWKDLLASLDEGGGDRLEETLAREVAGMGVEPEKLLPKARIDEIAAAVQTGDLDGARQVVKRLAPAATRRIVRRLFTDAALRDQVSAFVHRYQALVDDAVVRDPEGFLTAGLLGSDAGRLFLLLDAAAGDTV